ncbi:MAG: 30S ribosomal protein S20 [Nitriliruptor sp.]
MLWRHDRLPRTLARWYRPGSARTTERLLLRRFAPPAVAEAPPPDLRHPRERPCALERRTPTSETSRDAPMANIKSQIKRNRQNEARHERNKAVRSKLKTYTRRFRTAEAAGDKDAATAAFAEAAQALDKAASKGVIHRNTAANRKSGMAKSLQQL